MDETQAWKQVVDLEATVSDCRPSQRKASMPIRTRRASTPKFYAVERSLELIG
jgi:hypothetical protein